MFGVPTVEVAELPVDAVLLDVREDEEWVAGHAPQATHVPMSGLVERLGEVPEAEPLYVICRVGSRSARVVAFLNQRGHEAVNVTGGMQAWAAGGLPMIADGGSTPIVV